MKEYQKNIVVRHGLYEIFVDFSLYQIELKNANKIH